MIRLILSAFILSLCINYSVGYEIDLSTANGFEWEAALPNKSIINVTIFLLTLHVVFMIMFTHPQASRFQEEFPAVFTPTWMKLIYSLEGLYYFVSTI